jgi:hypothetical protein
MANYIEARLAQFRADAEKQIQSHANRRLSMTDQRHPITPPPELVQQWEADATISREAASSWTAAFATRAAQWGADQELEACCTQLSDPEWYDAIRNLRGPFRAAELRTARRPKPPSLKEQALELARPAGTEGAHVTFGPEELALIRRALESIND